MFIASLLLNPENLIPKNASALLHSFNVPNLNIAQPSCNIEHIEENRSRLTFLVKLCGNRCSIRSNVHCVSSHST